MTRTFAYALLTLAALGAAACGDGRGTPASPVTRPPQEIIAGGLTVRMGDRSLSIKNQTEYPVGFLVVEANMAIVALFPPCVGPQCVTLAQGAETTVRYDQILGYRPGATDAYLIWWRWVRKADGTLEAVGAQEQFRLKL